MKGSAVEFGARLAEARAHSGLTLEDIAGRTKIRVSALAALERGDVGNLPGGLYVREFLRAFAREVGCDPEEIVRQYRERCLEQMCDADSMGIANPDLQLTCPSGQISVAEIDARTRRWRAGWIGVGLLVIATATMHVMLRSGGSMLRANELRVKVRRAAGSTPTTTSSATASSIATVPVAASPDRMVATSGSIPFPAEIRDPAENRLRLDIKPTAMCWMSARADGQTVLYRLMKEGEQAQIWAHEEFVLTIGDPASCGFDINGAAVRQLGEPGRPVTIHLTPKNFVDFLQR